MERSDGQIDKDTTVLYLSMKEPDHYTPIFEVSKDMSHMMCGLFNVHGTIVLEKSKPLSDGEPRLFLCSDLCASSSFVAGKAKLPILRQLVVSKDGSVNMDIHNVLYLETSNKIFRNIRMYITDETGNIPSVERCSLNCTVLVFPKKR